MSNFIDNTTMQYCYYNMHVCQGGEITEKKKKNLQVSSSRELNENRML